MTIKDTTGIQTNNAILGYVACVWKCGIPHGNLMGQMMNDKPVHLMGVLFENQPQQSHMLYAGMLTRDNRIVSYKWPEIVQNPNISQISDSLSKDIHKQ